MHDGIFALDISAITKYILFFNTGLKCSPGEQAGKIAVKAYLTSLHLPELESMHYSHMIRFRKGVDSLKDRIWQGIASLRLIQKGMITCPIVDLMHPALKKLASDEDERHDEVDCSRESLNRYPVEDVAAPNGCGFA
ncbi:hypothetical protein SADUNF_Sadunf05G0034600 [Salix dunnii]|uniref:Uncharacterized protein n=1 Tax=Salix dunnii TaxID=1413687 RepID=A0A835K3J1_9ROSI|nr:hypothetical protein SADUNF_Sadunf05G0034600 [Salix dunnii]